MIPSYNEEKMIPVTAETIGSILSGAGIEYELIFVDDGSKDGTWSAICEESEKDSGVVGLHFSRNFGKEAAMFAGLERAKGDCVAVIDCDLQHPPEKLCEMYALWKDGYEVVEGVKEDRGMESGMHRFAANAFYGIISGLTGMDMANASDFKLLDRKVVDTLNNMPERSVFFRALSHWVGFKTASVSYCVRERTAGESKLSTKALIKYALTNISSFSAAPLQLVTWLGVAFLVFALVLGVQTIVRYVGGTALEGFTTVILLILISAGLIMVSLGIIGFYIAKIYDEIKGRPRYIISEERRKR